MSIRDSIGHWLLKSAEPPVTSSKPTSGTALPASQAQAWMGPGQFIPPIAPGTAPRLYDYPWNQNLNYAQRKYENISFERLRELARENYLVRVILEKVKARLCLVDWEFRLRSENGEPLAAVRERSASDSRVQFLVKFFEQPDGEHDWPEWLGAILEDRFVIDAATIWMARDRKGSIARAVPIDGSLINRIIDPVGMTPQPPYAAYQQLVKGMPAINFTSADLLYMPANYRSNKLFGFSEIEQTIRLGETQINRAMWALNHYTEGNIPELLLMFKSAEFSPEQIERFMATAESQLNGQLGQRQRMFPLPDATVHELRGTELFAEFDEWLARLFCYQMGEPPTALVKAVNRASAQQMDNTREESGEKPYLHWIRTKINRIIQNELYFGWADIECAPVPVAEIDGLKQAQIDQINIPLGVTTVDEARIRDGKVPLTPEQTEALKPAPKPSESDNQGDGEEGDTDEPEQAKAAGSKKKALRSVLVSFPHLYEPHGKKYLY